MRTESASPRLAADPVGPAPEFEKLIADLRVGMAGEPCRVDPLLAAAGAWRRPLRIQVAGRARAGKTSVLQALALISAEETAPVDEPGMPDPELDGDLIVYVVAASVRPADRRILAAPAPERTIVVLNKADAIGARWADAVAAAEQCAGELGMPVLPVVAELAVRTRARVPAEDDLRTLRRHVDRRDGSFTLSSELFTSADAGSDVADRRALLDRWSLYGASCALTALRHEPGLGPQPLLQLLHAASGIDAVHTLLHRRYERVAATRGGEFLDELARLAARSVPGDGSEQVRDLVEDYLASDEALRLGVRAGLACPDVAHLAAGYPALDPGDADDALARAERWRAVITGDLSAPARRAAVRVHNGYVRMWERMSSVGL